MPNWVKTVVKIRKIKPEDMDSLVNMICKEPEMSGTDEWTIDFNKIIPEPQTAEECDEAFIRTTSSHVGEDPDKPWFNWYAWHCQYWGAKWNAMDGYILKRKTYLVIVFSTAWSCAAPVIEKLAKLGYDIDVLYADEDLGANCGKASYKVNSGRWDWLYDDDLPDPRRFARDLWNNY